MVVQPLGTAPPWAVMRPQMRMGASEAPHPGPRPQGQPFRAEQGTSLETPWRGPPALGAWSLTLWTTREVPKRVSCSLIFVGHEEGWPPCPESVALLCLLWTAPLPSPPGFRAWPPVRESLPGPTAQPRRPGSPSRPADTSALCGQLHVLGHSSPGSWRGVSGVLGSLSWHARSRRLANCWGHLFSDENLACGPSLFGPSSCGADGAAGPQ